MDKSPHITKSLYNRKRTRVASSQISPDKLFSSNADESKCENTSSRVRALTAYGVAKAGTSDEAAERANRVAYDAGRHSLHYRHQEAMDVRLEQRITAALSELSVLEQQWKANREALQAVSLAMLRQWQPQLAMLARSACFHAYLHMDLDAFFAFAEERRAPQYRSVPMAVGSSAVLCTSNYLARPFGVRSAMPGFIARRLCPQLTIVPVDFAYYGALSTVVRGVLADYDSDFSTMSLDEATVDLAAYVARAYPPCTHAHAHTPNSAQAHGRGGAQVACSSRTVPVVPGTAAAAASSAGDHVSSPLSSLLPAGAPMSATPATTCSGASDLVDVSAPAPLLEVFSALGHGVAVHALPATDAHATTSTSNAAVSTAAPAGDLGMPPLPPVVDGGARRLGRADMWTCVQSGDVLMRVPSDALCSEAIRARFHACAACIAADEVRARLWRSVGVARDLRLSRLAHAVLTPHDTKSGAATTTTTTTTTPAAPAPSESPSSSPDALPASSAATEDGGACPCAACAWRILRYDDAGTLSLPHTAKDDLVLDGVAQVREAPPPSICRASLPRVPVHEAVFAAGRPRSVEQWQALLAAVARELRGRVHWHSGLTCSVGIACTRSLAKVCSDLNKPDGQCLVRPSAAATLTFLHSLPARKVPGVGRVSEKLLAALGVSTVGQLLSPRALMRVKHVLGSTQYQWLLAAAAGGPDMVEVPRLLMPASALGQVGSKSKGHFMAHSTPTAALAHMDAVGKVEDDGCTGVASAARSGASVSGLEDAPVKNSYSEGVKCAAATSERTHVHVGVHTPTSSVFAPGRGHSCTNTCARVGAAGREAAICSDGPVYAPASSRSRSRHTTHTAHVAALRSDALCKAPIASEGEENGHIHSVSQCEAANSLKCEPRECGEVAQQSFLAPCEGECVCVVLPISVAMHVRALCSSGEPACAPACTHSTTAATGVCDHAALGSASGDALDSAATTAAATADMSTSCVCVHQLDASLSSLCALSRALCRRHMEQQRQRAAIASPAAPVPMTYHGAYDPPPAAPSARGAGAPAGGGSEDEGADADAEEPEDLLHLLDELLAGQQVTPACCADASVAANGHVDDSAADTTKRAPAAPSFLAHAAALLPLWDAWSTRIGGGERADTSSSRKSVSCVRTFAGTDELAAIVSVLRRVWTRFCADVEELGVRGRCVGVTLKFTTYETRQRSETRRESIGAGVEGWQERLWHLALRMVLSEVGIPRDGQRARERDLVRGEGKRSKLWWDDEEVDLSEYEGRVRKACRLVGLRMSMLEGEEEDGRAGAKRQRGGLLRFGVEARGGDLWRGQGDAEDDDGRGRKKVKASVHERVASLWGDAGRQAEDGDLLIATGSESEAKAEVRERKRVEGGGERRLRGVLAMAMHGYQRAGAPAAATAAATVPTEASEDADADCVLVDATTKATSAVTAATVSPCSDVTASTADKSVAKGEIAHAGDTLAAMTFPPRACSSPTHAQRHARTSAGGRYVRVRWRRGQSQRQVDPLSRCEQQVQESRDDGQNMVCSAELVGEDRS